MSGTQQRLTLPQSRRMKSPAEFERCYERKRSASDGRLIVYACENERDHPRLGCSVSKKLGGAIVRNRFKRLLREAFRLEQHNLPPGVDLVVIPRPLAEATLESMRRSLVRLAIQAAVRLGTLQSRISPPSEGQGPEKGS